MSGGARAGTPPVHWHGRLRIAWGRYGALALFLVVAWGLAAFVAVRLVAPGDEVVFVSRGLLTGLLIAVPTAYLELRVLPRLARRLTFGQTLALRTAAYAATATAVVLLVAEGSLRLRGEGLAVLYERGELGAFLGTARFVGLVATLTAAAFLVNLGVQVRRALGPGLLLDLALGRYRGPVHEERLFLFLDLDGSTGLARRLGPLAFTDLKNDVFYDVAEPVLATAGRVVQYVGDEVVVTWPMARGLRNAAPLRCFFLVEDRLAARAGHYRRRYGVVPTVKGACHGGLVVTAEVGDVKREIAHSGDVVNTTARIEGLCRPLGARLLVSDGVVARLSLPDGIGAVDRGEHAVRGRDEPVHVWAVERPDPEGGSAAPLGGEAQRRRPR